MDLKTLAKSIFDASEPYSDWLNDDESEGDGFDLDDGFKDAVFSALQKIAKEFDMSVDKNYDAISTYYDIWARDEDGDFNEHVATVRASNHAQAYSGPIWSFDANDDLETVELGLEKVWDELDEFD